MTLIEQIGLTEYWFARVDPVFSKSLHAALQKHFVETVENVFEQYSKCGKHPQNWKAFKKIRDERNVRRITAGESNPTIEFLVGVSSILSIDTRKLLPETIEWISLATFYLITFDERKKLINRKFSQKEAFEVVLDADHLNRLKYVRCYARFLYENTISNQGRIQIEELHSRLSKLTKTESAGILKIAALVGQIIMDNSAGSHSN